MSAQQTSETCNVYLFPGQGSDERVFQKIKLPSQFTCTCISYPVPEPGQSLQQYARQFISKLDTSGNYILIGYSLGGMICTELADILSPDKVILISSAKTRNELPGLYTIQKKIRTYKVIPGRVVKSGALFLQPLVEPDRKKEKEVFISMLKAKDPMYLKRTSEMIVNWDRKSDSGVIVHIHGDKDNTIPIKNVKYNYKIKNGSHMMILTKGEEINQLINEMLE